MNEKDLVTFEQAKKLKELGFREKCFYGYFEEKLQIPTIDYTLESRNDYENPYWVDAPFLHQVQNWLREEKNIHITIDTYFPRWREGYYSIKEVNYECTIVIMKEDSVSREKIGNYNTYYEALNAGINKALELL